MCATFDLNELKTAIKNSDYLCAYKTEEGNNIIQHL